MNKAIQAFLMGYLGARLRGGMADEA